MENQIEVLETSDISNEEIERMFQDATFITETFSSPRDLQSTTINVQNASAETVGIPAQVFENSSEEEEKETAPLMEPIIKPNSPTILVDESTSRFSSAEWYSAVRDKEIVLAGIGGIGSYVVFLLSRMKPTTLLIYDPDYVECGNMSGQLYGNSDIGRAKVDSIAYMVSNYSNYYSIVSIKDRFTYDSITKDIMICGFDNMSSRSLFFDKWVRHVKSLPKEERKKCLFIDGRLAAEEFQVFCITGDDDYHQTVYRREYLFSDFEAEETICSYKQTSHCANMIGSIIVNLFVNFVANECEPLIPRDLPFITSYDAERMYFKTMI